MALSRLYRRTSVHRLTRVAVEKSPYRSLLLIGFGFVVARFGLFGVELLMHGNPQFAKDLLDRAKKIKLFLMDVDGTLTDGGVCLISPPDGGEILEMKVFNAKDGAGLTLAHIMGIKTGFITGRKSPAVQQRANEVHVDYVYLGQAKKTAAFDECIQQAGVTEEETAYMGDDLPDIPLAVRAGLAVAVADAAVELKAACHFTTNARGGNGSAREVIELILKAQGRWEEAVPKALA